MIRLKQISEHRLLKFTSIFAVLFVSAISVFLVMCSISRALDSSIQIDSAHTDFAAQEQGSWRVTQTATASDVNAAKLEIKAESILKGDGKDKDVYVMLDTSGSMTNDRINKMTNTIISLANTLLADGNGNNRIAMDAFNSDIYDVSGWTNDSLMFQLRIGDYLPAANGGTNYYKAIQEIDEVFANYTYDENRDPIVLFITDGAPVEDHPLEEPEYLVLKQKYPWLTVQGIQFEMGETVINQIKKVSDNQFTSNSENVEDVIFEAAMDGYKYSEFRLNDYINDDYYEIASVSATAGNATTNQNQITWNMDNVYRSGTKQTLTVMLNVKQACIDKDDSLCAVNEHTTVSTKLKDVADESTNTTESPVLRFRFDVSYDLNAPASCDIDPDTAPATSKQLIYSSVEISDYTPACSGYRFDGWSLVSDATYRYNDNYFRMPEEDVTLRAVWSKLSILKTTEGTVAPTTYAMFKKAVPQTHMAISSRNGYDSLYATAAGSLNNIEHIVYSTDKPPIDATLDDAHNFADASSDLPIYGYYVAETKTFYFYSDADVVQLNPDSRGLFAEFKKLKSIEGVGKFDDSLVTTLDYLFYRTSGGIESPEALLEWDLPNLTSLGSAFLGTGLKSLHGVENWDVSKVTNLSYLTYNSGALTDISALLDWDTSSVTTLAAAFDGLGSITNLHGLENWDVTKVTSMNHTFENTHMLENTDALANWQTDSLVDIAGLFRANTGSTQAGTLDISGISGWDVSKVTTMSYTFYGRKSLRSLDGLSNWRPVALTNMTDTFLATSITNLDGLAGWQTPVLTTMEETFMDCNSLTDISGLANWDVRALTSAYRIFARARSLAVITPLSGWQTDSLTNVGAAFWETKVASADGIGGWNAKKITSTYSMFASDKSLTDISALASWETDSLINMRSMFSGASNLASLHGLENWNVSKVTSMEATFNECSKLASISELRLWRPVALTNMYGTFRYTPLLASLDGLQDWRTPVLSNMAETFLGSSAFTNVAELADWTVGAVSNMESTFYNASSLSDISGLSGWDTGSVTNMANIFRGSGITSVAPLSGWNTAKVTTLMGAFSGTKLVNLNGLSSWDVSRVSSMYLIFGYVPTLTSISGLRGWTTSSLGRFDEAFAGDSALLSLDGLQGWDVSKVSVMGYLFKNCTSLADISALSGWSTGRVSNMGEIFRNDSAITDVSALAGWNVESVTNINQGFRNTSVTDFSSLNGWRLPSGSNTSNMFAGTPEGAILPSWN